MITTRTATTLLARCLAVAVVVNIAILVTSGAVVVYSLAITLLIASGIFALVALGLIAPARADMARTFSGRDVGAGTGADRWRSPTVTRVRLSVALLGLLAIVVYAAVTVTSLT